MRNILDEDIDALTSLRLTILQSKVFLVLVEIGEASIKEVAKASGVARQDLYRIMVELQGRGLVEKRIGNPNTYKAMPLIEAISVLLESVHKERNESRRKILNLMQRYKGKKRSLKPQTEEPYFILVYGKSAHAKKLKKVFRESSSNIDCITTLKRFRSLMTHFDKEIKETCARGVKIRLITEKSEEKSLLLETVKHLERNPLFRLRYVQLPLQTPIMIVNDKEVTVVSSAKAGLGESPTLWSNNPVLITLFRDYFETIWSSTRKHKLGPTTNLRKTGIIQKTIH